MSRLADFAEYGRYFWMKHRIKILDLGFLAALLATAMLFAFELDVFESEGKLTQRQERLRGYITEYEVNEEQWLEDRRVKLGRAVREWVVPANNAVDPSDPT